MYNSPDLTAQLAREHHRAMLAEARQRQLRHQLDLPASRPLKATRTLVRRLAAVFASPSPIGRAGATAPQVPDAL